MNSIPHAGHKPLKRHPALVPLSHDHHSGLLLCWKIRMGIRKHIAAERIAAYVLYYFDEHLLPHFQEEETCIFLLFNPEDELRIAAEQQHRELRQLREDLQHHTDRQPQVLRKIEKLLEAHIRFEERQLFTRLQEKLSAEQLSELQASIQRVHVRRKDHWQDIFWSTP